MQGPQDLQQWSHPSFWKRAVRLCLCLVDVIRVECASVSACVHLCPLMFLYECLACRGGWSGLENILCDSTSGQASLAFDIPPLITARATPGLFIQRALVGLASPGGTLWQHMRAASLEPQQMERLKKNCYKKKQIQKKLWWAEIYSSFQTWDEGNNDYKRSLWHYDEITAGGMQWCPRTLTVRGMKAGPSAIIVPH